MDKEGAYPFHILVPCPQQVDVQIDIFSKDIILIPINHGNAHWTAAAINFRKKRIEAYDSMNMNPSPVHKVRNVHFPVALVSYAKCRPCVNT